MGAPDPAAAFDEIRVLDAWDETPTMRALRLDLRGLAARHTRPGQVLRIQAPGATAEGYFALATRPGAEAAEVLLKRGAHVADAIVAEARAGHALAAAGPVGAGFPVEQAAGRDVVMFAAGSGVSPIRALVQQLVDVRREVGRVALFYGQRHEADFAFRAEHEAWARAGVEVVLCASSPSAAWDGERGWVQDVAAAHAFGGVDLDGAVAFLCGMKSMVQGARERLAQAGLPVERTFLNY